MIAHCAVTGGDPVTTLDEAFGVLIALTRSGVLVPDGSDEAETVTARRQAGDRVGPAVVDTPIRLVRDTEIWRGRLDDGRSVIVKTVDQPGLGPDLFAREVAALRAARRRPRARAVLAAGRAGWRNADHDGGRR